MKFKFIISFCILFLVTSLQAKTIIFIHGGPGFNAEPERNLLGPYLKSLNHEAYFWNEPSELRPGYVPNANAFDNANDEIHAFIQNICDEKTSQKADCKLTIVAHSYGVHYAVRLAESFSNAIVEMILVSPALDVAQGDKNILNLAVAGLDSEGRSATSDRLKAMIPNLKEEFDMDKIQAFMLAGEYTSLFVNYWSDMNLMQKYFSYLQGEFSFDAKGMIAVRMGMPLVNQQPVRKIGIPTQVYFGANDPVAVATQQMPILEKYFDIFDVHLLSNAKHYPHIERLTSIKY